MHSSRAFLALDGRRPGWTARRLRLVVALGAAATSRRSPQTMPFDVALEIVTVIAGVTDACLTPIGYDQGTKRRLLAAES